MTEGNVIVILSGQLFAELSFMIIHQRRTIEN